MSHPLPSKYLGRKTEILVNLTPQGHWLIPNHWTTGHFHHPCPTPHLHINKDLFKQFFSSSLHTCLALKKKKKVASHTRRLKNKLRGKSKHQNQNARNVKSSKLSDWEIKISTINMLRVLMDKTACKDRWAI